MPPAAGDRPNSSAVCSRRRRFARRARPRQSRAAAISDGHRQPESRRSRHHSAMFSIPPDAPRSSPRTSLWPGSSTETTRRAPTRSAGPQPVEQIHAEKAEGQAGNGERADLHEAVVPPTEATRRRVGVRLAAHETGWSPRSARARTRPAKQQCRGDPRQVAEPRSVVLLGHPRHPALSATVRLETSITATGPKRRSSALGVIKFKRLSALNATTTT